MAVSRKRKHVAEVTPTSVTYQKLLVQMFRMIEANYRQQRAKVKEYDTPEKRAIFLKEVELKRRQDRQAARDLCKTESLEKLQELIKGK